LQKSRCTIKRLDFFTKLRQVTLNVILQSQAYILNYVKKVAGHEETLEETTKFLEKLKEDAHAALQAKLAEAKDL
jgi:hypothetical protein